MVILVTLIAYFIILLLLGKVTAGRATNSTFYSADRRSPWGMVAFGMIGASVSGVTFVSVPGMVIGQDMTYLQTCLGFIVGYFIVAFVLLPLYYRMATPSIYSLLSARIGQRAYKSGAAFFLLSELTGASLKFYVACIVLQRFVLDEYGVPFFLTVPALMLLIWLYTRRGGIRTLVVTDAFQTAAMLAAVALIVYVAADRLGLTVSQAARAVAASGHARIFEFANFMSPQNFWKQFVSGAFIVIVMTGLNQTIMQKNLTCKTLGEARKDMCTYAFAFVPVNLLFLSLGVLLLMLAQKEGCAAPAQPDELLPMFAATGRLGTVVTVLFVIGVVAASASTVDSSLTAMTTTLCVDVIGRPDDERLRRRAHLAMACAACAFIMAYRYASSASLIDAVYTLASYTYGPLLGLFAYSLFIAGKQSPAGRAAADRLAPYACCAAPLLCLAASEAASRFTPYRFGYELLLLNGLITQAILCLKVKR